MGGALDEVEGERVITVAGIRMEWLTGIENTNALESGMIPSPIGENQIVRILGYFDIIGACKEPREIIVRFIKFGPEVCETKSNFLFFFCIHTYV